MSEQRARFVIHGVSTETAAVSTLSGILGSREEARLILPGITREAYSGGQVAPLGLDAMMSTDLGGLPIAVVFVTEIAADWES